MRRTAQTTVLAVLATVLAVACTGQPPAASVATVTSFDDVDGTAVYGDWPAVARRSWPGSGTNGMPAGFIDEVLYQGLEAPTALRFLPDGRLVVTEQAGLVKVYPAASGTDPVLLLDLRTEVLLNNQLGLLGLAVDPDFEREPYVYLAYTRDALPGGTTPTYGSPDGNDACPSRFACPASARLVRYRVDDIEGAAGTAEVLIDDWCISGPNHSIGTIAFAADGALLVGGGDGADGDLADLGQATPANPCADPDGQGGSLRSQDLILGSDPVGLAGTIARVDRATGEALPDNPLADSADPNARRIVAYGLRNPFRFGVRPGTDETWIADVGWNSFEEINRLPARSDGPINFGWPCVEGAQLQSTWQDVAGEACEAVNDDPQLTPPEFAFARGVEGDQPCDTSSASTSALVFYDGSLFPDQFQDALFFADLSLRCLFVVEAGADGQPDPTTTRLFAYPVRLSDVVVGADGAMYYTQLVKGEIHRISWR